MVLVVIILLLLLLLRPRAGVAISYLKKIA
jgi:hypothetical protein